MRTENWKKIVTGCGMVLLAAYVGGFFEILFSRSEVCLSPLQCLYAGCGTSSGRKWSMAAVVLLLALTVLVIWRGKTQVPEENNKTHCHNHATIRSMKKKMMKKFHLLLLLAAMFSLPVTLTSCGDDDDDDNVSITIPTGTATNLTMERVVGTNSARIGKEELNDG